MYSEITVIYVIKIRLSASTLDKESNISDLQTLKESIGHQ